MRAAGVIAIAVVLAGCGGSPRASTAGEDRAGVGAAAARAPAAPSVPAPSAREPIPRSPQAVSVRLSEVAGALRREIRAWRRSKPSRRASPPAPIGALALYEQRVYRLLARRPRLADATLARLGERLRGPARDSIAALRALFELSSPTDERRFRVSAAAPPDVLLGHYRAAQRRFGVRWTMLAAVNMVETNFGRLRNVSSAGAIGPMQFLPATWRAYGLGGDIRDPRDAILGAANYLHASGAPARPAQALYAYNPSRLYVAAVQRWARRMALDPKTFYGYWSWGTFVRTRRGDVQLVDERG